MSVNSLFRLTIENGGGTFDRNLVEIRPQKGFAVGISHEALLLDDLEGLEDSINRVLFDFPLAMVGTWINDGWLYVDPVFLFEHEENAVRFAKNNKQIAIYDFEKGKSINVA